MIEKAVTIEFDANFGKRLEQFFTEECIDREKWYKKMAFQGIEKCLVKWERQQDRIKRLSHFHGQREGTT
jgi:hypothetical protein